MRKHEDICIGFIESSRLFPQMKPGSPYDKGHEKSAVRYGDFKSQHVKSEGERYPNDVIYLKTAESEDLLWILHRNQLN